MKAWIYRGIVLGIVAASLFFAGRWGYDEAMKRAWIKYNEYDIRSEGSLQVGDLAPDLKLTSVDNDTIQLSQLYVDKPLVLVFGSYT